MFVNKILTYLKSLTVNRFLVFSSYVTRGWYNCDAFENILNFDSCQI